MLTKDAVVWSSGAGEWTTRPVVDSSSCSSAMHMVRNCQGRRKGDFRVFRESQLRVIHGMSAGKDSGVERLPTAVLLLSHSRPAKDKDAATTEQPLELCIQPTVSVSFVTCGTGCL